MYELDVLSAVNKYFRDSTVDVSVLSLSGSLFIDLAASELLMGTAHQARLLPL